MFELLDRSELGVLTDAELTDQVERCTRLEAKIAAQRLAAIAEVWARHCEDEDDASALQVIDGWESAVAVISAACTLTRGAASSQMSIARALRVRLPKVAAVFARGEISAKVVSKITWRTALITDDDALGLVDTALAGAAQTYGALSDSKAEQAIDVWVDKFDPAAVRKTRTAARERDVCFGVADDPSGMVTIWGRLLATDAALIKKLLTTMARGVCDNDPRTIGQRRADSLGAIGAGADHLTCLCGSPTCDATGVDPRSRAVVIHLLAQTRPEWATPPDSDGDGGGGDGSADADTDDEPAGDDTTTTDIDIEEKDGADTGDELAADMRDADTTADTEGDEATDSDEVAEADGAAEFATEAPVDEAPAAAVYGLTEAGDTEVDDTTTIEDGESDLVDGPVTPAPVPADRSGPPRDPRIHGTPAVGDFATDNTPTVYGSAAIILGGGIVPAPLLAELIATGATIDHLTHPENLTTQDHYRPSAKMATFVRMRDMICMFPGCGVSATYCDLDHTVPWPHGATHPGNLGPKCRNHHLLKTFRTGEDGWTDTQHPDGSHTWTAPTGHTYRTIPFSRILFPDWNPHTPAPPPGPTPPATTDRDMKMPLRKRTRQQTRTQRINTERRHNTEHDKPPPY